MNRPPKGDNHGDSRRAFAPKFPKPKDEGWFLVLGSVEENELLALKRAGLPKGGGGGAQHQVTFFTPETPGRVVYTLYIMSDAYLGLDQEYDLCLEVVEGHEEPSDEYDDDEARFALLAKEKDRMDKRGEARSASSSGTTSNYEKLG